MMCAVLCCALSSRQMCIRRLGFYLGNERLSIVGCRDEIRTIGCTLLHNTNLKSYANMYTIICYSLALRYWIPVGFVLV
ncbi:hypothetical protein RHMOL_Rhmol01G0141000 [Rhododendron molle]|uniref:Uncharacterized protein n=1 Tax=Rhododendron molle TaxID=49168 RepID=A0ACC0Q2Q0_RHOML|nr:hypothetical protein RHMOL_Rhmol01G0141000 [Rhododendron molle]